MAAVRIVPENSETDNRQIKFQSARTRCVNPESESEPGRVSVIWNEVFVFEVQAGVRLPHHFRTFHYHFHDQVDGPLLCNVNMKLAGQLNVQ